MVITELCNILSRSRRFWPSCTLRAAAVRIFSQLVAGYPVFWDRLIVRLTPPIKWVSRQPAVCQKFWGGECPLWVKSGHWPSHSITSLARANSADEMPDAERLGRLQVDDKKVLRSRADGEPLGEESRTWS